MIKKNTNSIFLMQKDIPVLEFNIDTFYYKVHNEKLLPYVLRDSLILPSFDENLTVDELADIKAHNRSIVVDYLARRVLNLNRENAKKILNAYDFSQSQDSETKARIAITCKAVSMIDDYWLNDNNLTMKWKDVNPRNNHLNEIVAHIALFGKSFTATGLPHTPEMTGQGAYAKAWMRKSDGMYLYKKSTKGGIESDIEVMTSNILDCFNIDHINYFSEKVEGHSLCVCKNMSTDNYCIVPAEDIFIYCNRKDINFMKYALNIDSDSIYKMCVMDYLISNRDRHMLNWGFYMNNATGNLLKCHPLFDHNNAFDTEFMRDKEGGKSLIFSGKTQKEVAHMAIKKCKIKCIKPVTKDIFINDEMYYSFMSRAAELGLYKEIKPTFFQKVHFASYEKYVPVEIDNNYDKNTYKVELDKLIEKDNEQFSKMNNMTDNDTPVFHKSEQQNIEKRKIIHSDDISPKANNIMTVDDDSDEPCL